MYCSSVTHDENLDPINCDSFKQLVERLVDQGLLQSNCDVDRNIMQRGNSNATDMPVRFGSQLIDIQAAVADKLEASPIYKKLADRVAANPYH